MEIAEVADITWVTRRPPVFHDEPFTHEYGRAVERQGGHPGDRRSAGVPGRLRTSATRWARTGPAALRQLRFAPLLPRVLPKRQR